MNARTSSAASCCWPACHTLGASSVRGELTPAPGDTSSVVQSLFAAVLGPPSLFLTRDVQRDAECLAMSAHVLDDLAWRQVTTVSGFVSKPRHPFTLGQM